MQLEQNRWKRERQARSDARLVRRFEEIVRALRLREGEIEAAVAFSKRWGTKLVIVGGADAWRVTDLLRKEQVPVILGRTHSLPPRETTIRTCPTNCRVAPERVSYSR